jgi:hypothetical protein
MRNASYSMTKRVNETWKKNEVVVIDDQRKNLKKLGHSRRWIENIKQVNMSEVYCCKKNAIDLKI